MFLIFFWAHPFCLVIGDDRVIRYTGAGDAEGAQATEWGLVGIRARDITIMLSLSFEILGIVTTLWFTFT